MCKELWAAFRTHHCFPGRQPSPFSTACQHRQPAQQQTAEPVLCTTEVVKKSTLRGGVINGSASSSIGFSCATIVRSRTKLKVAGGVGFY